LALCALLLFACEKREIKEPVSYNDAEFLMGGLVSQDRVSGSVNPIMGQFTADNEITIPVESYEEARELFESIISPDAQVERSGSSIIWHLTDGQGASLGDAVFDKGPEPHWRHSRCLRLATLSEQSNTRLPDRIF
jgi:hypothetical protein